MLPPIRCRACVLFARCCHSVVVPGVVFAGWCWWLWEAVRVLLFCCSAVFLFEMPAVFVLASTFFFLFFFSCCGSLTLFIFVVVGSSMAVPFVNGTTFETVRFAPLAESIESQFNQGTVDTGRRCQSESFGQRIGSQKMVDHRFALARSYWQTMP